MKAAGSSNPWKFYTKLDLVTTSNLQKTPDIWNKL